VGYGHKEVERNNKNQANNFDDRPAIGGIRRCAGNRHLSFH
jgi:hypothetical protein